MRSVAIALAVLLVLWCGSIFYFILWDSKKPETISTIEQKNDQTVETFLQPTLRFYFERDCAPSSQYLEFIDDGSVDGVAEGMCRHTVEKKPLSFKLFAADNSRIIDIFSSCNNADDAHYVASLYPLDDCVNIYNYPSVESFRFVNSDLDKRQVSDEEIRFQTQSQGLVGIPETRIVFSCESSEYFGYQVWANFYGFLSSNQKSASWTRLLTAKERDDLADANKGLATFQARRHMYARRYSPINKADVIQKWFASVDKPKEEIILVIDPDNWLLKDISPWTKRVKKGRALGEAAYYHGSKTAQKLWKELCEKNCDWDMDLVGVPYVVHRDDLEVIAPLWKHYSLKIKEALEHSNPKRDEFDEKYKRLDVNWASEMFGYNMASAHAGVIHEVVQKMQVRDVHNERKFEQLKDVAMIHMGRAWFPRDDPSAKKWIHTEGKSFRSFGDQVWCKCNYTASEIMPWPIPEGTDFQSTKTLEILHYSQEKFGPIPINKRYRKGAVTRSDYSWSMP